MAASSVDGECCDEEVILNDTIYDSTLEQFSCLLHWQGTWWFCVLGKVCQDYDSGELVG